MKILIVHPRMSIMGGGERVVVHCILAASRAGHDVDLLSEEFDAKQFEDFFGCPGLLGKVSHQYFPKFNPKGARSLLLYRRLYYYQRQFGKALPHVGHSDLVLGTQDVGYVPSTKVPIVQYCYFPEYFGHLETHPSSPLWQLYYRPARMYYRYQASRVDRFLSVSEYTRMFVRKIWGRDSETLYPPCPIDLYSTEGGRRENLVVSIGRIVPEKRIHLFIQMAREISHCKFAVIGSVSEDKSDYYRWLRSISPGNVYFVISPLRKVRDMLARAKVYVHCAENEHFGIAIVEAMAAGCVPVVHDSGGPKEIVQREVGYRWNNVEEAIRRISDLLTNDGLRGRLSEAAAARARLYGSEQFEAGIERVLSRYEDQTIGRSLQSMS